MTPAQAAPAAARPPVRVFSSVDTGMGLRFLSADGTIFTRFGVWSLPFAVGAIDRSGEPMPWVSESTVERQLQGLAQADGGAPVLWVRTALLGGVATVDAVAEYIEAVKPAGYVLDPELFDNDGRPRGAVAAVEGVRRKLLPASDVAVVNNHEAAALSGRVVEGLSTMRDACRALVDRGAGAVVITGGHLESFPRDLVYDGHGFDEVGADRIAVSGALRGAGGIFSAVVTAGLVRGKSLIEAAEQARKSVSAAIEARLRVVGAGLLRVDEVPAEQSAGGLWIANASRVPAA